MLWFFFVLFAVVNDTDCIGCQPRSVQEYAMLHSRLLTDVTIRVVDKVPVK